MKIDISAEKKELIRATGKLNAACIELLAQLTAMPDEAEINRDALPRGMPALDDKEGMRQAAEADGVANVLIILRNFARTFDKEWSQAVRLCSLQLVLKGSLMEDSHHAED